jgi:hypothetical protein
LGVTANRSEIEGPVQQERGETFHGKKVRAVSSFISFGGSALVHQPSSSECDDLETQHRCRAVHRHSRSYANQALRVVRARVNCLTVTSCRDIREDAPISVQDVEQPLQCI